ncbi:hypothetical protein MTO96_002238 [Rhipicephalus appendiculatus]
MSMYQIADKFDVSESTVHVAICRVLDLFSISAREIRWPDREEKERTKRAFQDALARRGITGLPDVIGAVDGCHIRISRPTESEESYYNRKKFHSIILQGICNADMAFIDVFVGFPGSVHDARVLRESFFFEVGASKCEGGYLLGDAAYPLLQWLLPPYRPVANWQPWMTSFNKRLLYLDVTDIEQAVRIVIGACVLHNVARSGDTVEEVADTGTDVSSTDPIDDQTPAVSAAAMRDTGAELQPGDCSGQLPDDREQLLVLPLFCHQAFLLHCLALPMPLFPALLSGLEMVEEAVNLRSHAVPPGLFGWRALGQRGNTGARCGGLGDGGGGSWLSASSPPTSCAVSSGLRLGWGLATEELPALTVLAEATGWVLVKMIV